MPKKSFEALNAARELSGEALFANPRTPLPVLCTSEVYNAPVLIATEDVFRFQHEYMPMRWEISDMRKIGTLHPNQDTRRIMQAAKKRKPKGGVFQF